MTIARVFQLNEVNVDKKCPDDCGCITIHGALTTDSVMWTHENVRITVQRTYEKVVMQSGRLYEAKPDDEYVDLVLPCGTLVGYVEAASLPEN